MHMIHSPFPNLFFFPSYLHWVDSVTVTRSLCLAAVGHTSSGHFSFLFTVTKHFLLIGLAVMICYLCFVVHIRNKCKNIGIKWKCWCILKESAVWRCLERDLAVYYHYFFIISFIMLQDAGLSFCIKSVDVFNYYYYMECWYIWLLFLLFNSKISLWASHRLLLLWKMGINFWYLFPDVVTWPLY